MQSFCDKHDKKDGNFKEYGGWHNSATHSGPLFPIYEYLLFKVLKINKILKSALCSVPNSADFWFPTICTHTQTFFSI